MAERVGIFGGSFDPVHNGHIGVVGSILNSHLVDDVWILLTPYPPHKSAYEQASYKHRLNMLKLAFTDYGQVTISDVEQSLPKPSYTLQTLNHLTGKYPKKSFFLCLGEDSIESFHTWYKYKEIMKLVTLIVAERPGFDAFNVKPTILSRAVFVEHHPVDLSSTQIRSNKSESIKNLIPEPVADYISKHNLYDDETT